MMNDGSRHFLLLPQKCSPIRLLLHILFLRGACPTAYVPGVDESWIGFRYRDHKFSVNNQFGDYWFFVSDPACPDETLHEVETHFAKALL